MFRGFARRFAVAYDYAINLFTAYGFVKNDNGNILFEQWFDIALSAIGSEQYEAINLPSQHHLEFGILNSSVAARGGENNDIALVSGNLLNCLHSDCGKRVSQVRHDHRDRRRSLSLQSAGQLIRLVAQLGHHLANPGSRGWPEFG